MTDADRRRISSAGPLAYLVMQVAISGFHGYGYFIDELYYIACSKRLAWGYIDHPPLAPFLLSLSRWLLGDSIPSIRFLPALAGSATIFMTGLMTRELGGGRFAQAVAMLCTAISPVLLIYFGIFSMNAFDALLWAIAGCLLIRLLRTDNPKVWLPLGLVAGIGLLNKHTFVLLGIGLAAGLALTPARRHLRRREPWLGALLALVIFLPNLVWQYLNHWVSLEFYRNATLYKNVPTGALKAVLDQIVAANPATLPIWVAGVGFLLASPRGKPFRPLGWCFVILFLVMIASGLSRPDRIAAAYLFPFAAGGVAIELIVERQDWGAWKGAIPALLLLAGAALAPLAIPVLPPAALARYAAALRIMPQLERGKPNRLPQWLADRFGWEEMVATVAGVYRALPPAERTKTLIVANNYGNAGALELFGPAHGLPPVISTHNNYFLWGPGDSPAEVFIAVGVSREDLEPFFEEVEQAASTRCDYCYQDRMPIYVGRHPKADIRQVWPTLKHLE